MNDFNENLINQKMDKAIISYQNDLNGIREVELQLIC